MAIHKNLSFGGLAFYRISKNFSPEKRTRFFKIMTACLTYLAYMSYTMLRRAFIVAIPTLTNGSLAVENGTEYQKQAPWPPFGSEGKGVFIAGLSILFLSAYALGMFIAGRIAERTDLRYNLTIGLGLSSLFCCCFGMGKIFKVHNYLFFVFCQFMAGLMQSTGRPATITCLGNWFGLGNRGFILGIWNSNNPVGNVLGSVIAGVFVDTDWSLSFIVLASISFGIVLIIFLFLVPTPAMVDCLQPLHYSIDESMGIDEFICKEEPTYGATLQHQKNQVNNQEKLAEENSEDDLAIGIIDALKVPGVIEYSLCFFFNKFVYQAFLYWLPNYIEDNLHSTNQKAANLSTLYDVGGLIGGIAIGVFSDWMGDRSSISAIALFCAAPLMFLYKKFSSVTGVASFLLLMVGFTVGGTQSLIVTAASSDLGTHKSLRGKSRALATITGIVAGTGSCGAALGAGVCFLMDASNVFRMLILSDLLSLLLLTRLIVKTILHYRKVCSSGYDCI